MKTGNKTFLDTNFIEQVIRSFQEKGFDLFFQPEPPSIYSKPKIDLPDYYGDKYKCYKSKKSISRYVIMINHAKFDQCHMALDKL